MIFERLYWLRHSFSDEIIDEELHGEGDFKFRRNWWQALVTNLWRGVELGLVPVELRDEVLLFIIRYSSESFHRQRLTTRDDITTANEIIDKVLSHKS